MVDKTTSKPPPSIDLEKCGRPASSQGMSRVGTLDEVQNKPDLISGSTDNACVSGQDVYYDFMKELEAPDVPVAVRAPVFGESSGILMWMESMPTVLSDDLLGEEIPSFEEELEAVLVDLQSIRDTALARMELDQQIRTTDLLGKINSMKLGVRGLEAEIKTIPAAINNRKEEYKELSKMLDDHKSPKVELLIGILVSGSLFGVGVPMATLLGQRLLAGQGLIGEIYRILLRHTYRGTACEEVFGNYRPSLQFLQGGKALGKTIIKNLIYTLLGSGVYLGGKSFYSMLEQVDDGFAEEQKKLGDKKYASVLDQYPGPDQIQSAVMTMSPDDLERYLADMYADLEREHSRLTVQALTLRQRKAEWDEKLEKVTTRALQGMSPDEIVDPELKQLVIDFKEKGIEHDPIDDALRSDSGQKVQMVLDLTVAFGIAAPTGHWLLEKVIAPEFFANTLDKLKGVQQQVFEELRSGCLDDGTREHADDAVGEEVFFGETLGAPEARVISYPGLLPNLSTTTPTLQARPAIKAPRLTYSRAPVLESAMSMGAANAGSYSLVWQQPLRMAAGGAEFMSSASVAQFYAAPEPATARPVLRVFEGGRFSAHLDLDIGNSANLGNYTTENAPARQASSGRSLVTGLLLYEGGYVLINGVMYAVGADGKIVDTTNKIYGAGGMALGANYLLKNPAMLGPAVAMIPGMQLGGNVARGELEESIRATEWSPPVQELTLLGTQAVGSVVGASTSWAAVESLAAASRASRVAAGTGVGLVILAISNIYSQFKRDRDLQKAEDGFRNNATIIKDFPKILQRFDEIKAVFDANSFDAVTFYAFDAANTDQILKDYDARLDKLEKYFKNPDPVTKDVMACMGYWFEEKYFSRWDDLSSDFKMMSHYGDGFAMDLRDALLQKYRYRVSHMRSVLQDPYLEDLSAQQLDRAVQRADPQKVEKLDRDLQQLLDEGTLNPDQANQEMTDALSQGKLSKDPVVTPKTFVIPDSLDLDALYDAANADYEIMTKGWYTRKGYPNETFMAGIRHELRMKIVSYKKDEGLSPEACAVKTTRLLESVLRDLQKLMDHKGGDFDFNSAVIMQGSLDNMTALLQDYRNTADPVYLSTTLSEKKSILSHLNDFTVAYLSRG